MERTTEFPMEHYVKPMGNFIEAEGMWHLDLDKLRGRLENEQDIDNIDRYNRVIDDLSKYSYSGLRCLVNRVGDPIIINLNGSYYKITKNGITIRGSDVRKHLDGVLDWDSSLRYEGAIYTTQKIKYDWNFFEPNSSEK